MFAISENGAQKIILLKYLFRKGLKYFKTNLLHYRLLNGKLI